MKTCPMLHPSPKIPKYLRVRVQQPSQLHTSSTSLPLPFTRAWPPTMQQILSTTLVISSWLAHLDNPPVVSQRKPCLECARGWGSQLPWTSWKVQRPPSHSSASPSTPHSNSCGYHQTSCKKWPSWSNPGWESKEHEEGPSVTNWQAVIWCQSGSIWSPLPPSADRVVYQSPSCTITFTLTWRQGRISYGGTGSCPHWMGYQSSSIPIGRKQRPSTYL